MCFFNHINGARVNKVFGLENQMCYRHCIVILFFITIICESGDKTNIKAAKRAYYIEAEVVKILPEERHMDGTLTSGSDLSIVYPIVGRDTTIGYESIYYLTQEQYDDAVIGGKVRISLKGK